jgi:hypothetical protein
MKKFIFPVILLTFSLLLSVGCSTKFNVAAPYKNITVIYAYLETRDTAHYIRVQKAFLDENKSAVSMAQTSDSNFYSNISVKIERHSVSGTGALYDIIPLTKVDLAAEGYQKAPGVFFNTPNYAYKFKGTLDPNYIYRLKVTNLTTGKVDSADAPILDDINSFVVDVIDDTNLNRAGLDFSLSFNSHVFEFISTYAPVSNFNFENMSSPAYIAQGVITFNWVDSNVVSKAKTNNSYNYTTSYISFVGNQADMKVSNLDLYTAVAAGMGKAPANIVRLINRCNITVYMSTYDFYLYQQTTSTQGLGLTGSEIEPIATNIKGPDALGLYTSRGSRSGLLTITHTTIDSLRNNVLTQPANIVGTAY